MFILAKLSTVQMPTSPGERGTHCGIVTPWSVLLSTRKEVTDTHNGTEESNKHDNEQNKANTMTVHCVLHLCEMKAPRKLVYGNERQRLRLWGACIHWEGALLEHRGSSVLLSEGLTWVSKTCALSPHKRCGFEIIHR